MRQNPLAYLAVELDSLKSQGLYRKLRVLEGEQRATTTVGHRPVVGTITGTMAIHSALKERLGGYVAGNRAAIEFLHHRARPFLFSTSHPPSVATSGIAALDTFSRVGTELGIIP